MYNPTLAKYVISQYNGVQGNNDIYYHNGTITSDDEFVVNTTTYPAGTVLDANDNSYRYAGADPDNYVCFGSSENSCSTNYLYRIIGLFDNKIKLIKVTVASSDLLGTDGAYKSDGYYNWSNSDSCSGLISYSFQSDVVAVANRKNILAAPPSSASEYGCNIWKYSELNLINLNTNFINNIGIKLSNKIATTTWKVGGNGSLGDYSIPLKTYENEIVNPYISTTYDAKIGLMYVSDYIFSVPSTAWKLPVYDRSTDVNSDYRTVKSLNWMHLDLPEWTITPSTDSEINVYSLYLGDFIYSQGAKTDINVRPVFYLNSDVIYKFGTGTSSDPIILGD